MLIDKLPLLPDPETHKTPGSFSIGNGVFVGTRECAPCAIPGESFKLTHAGFGGIRARIIGGGSLSVGESMRVPQHLVLAA